MALPAFVAPLVEGASSVLGGLFGSKANRRAQARSEAFQREFAQHGVRWRVEDAKAAGLHPLFAMGFQPPMASPVVIPDSMGPAIAEAGQSVGRAISAQQTVTQRRAEELQLQLLGKQIEESDARIGVLHSEQARNMQEALQSSPFPGVYGDPFISGTGFLSNEAFTHQVLPGVTAVQPSTTVATAVGDTARAAGTSPLWREFQLAPDLKMVLPGGISGDAAEVLESLAESPILMAITVRENNRRFGPAWSDEMFNRYGFGNPSSQSSLWEKIVGSGRSRQRRVEPTGAGPF